MNIINHILVLFLWLSAPVLHPLHLSVCNIEVDDEKKVMRVTIKVFTDDLENAVLKKTGTKVSLTDTEVLDRKSDSLVNEYIQSCLVLSFDDDTKLKLDYLGRMTTDDSQKILFQVYDFERLDRIRVQNKVLCDLFDDQKNLVFVVYNEDNKAYSLGSENSEFIYSFETGN